MKHNGWISAACVLVSLFQTASADDYSAAVKELGGLGSGASATMKQPDKFVPRYNPNPPMAEAYYGGGISLPTQYGEDKIAKCASQKAHTDLYLRQECEGVNLIAGNKTKRPDITLSSNEKLVKGTQKIAGNPADTLDKYKWKYPVNADGSIGSIPDSACPTETVTIPAVTKEKDCRKFSGAELFLCQATLKVKVDPNWNYSCLETKFRNQQHQCAKKLVVVCERAPDCTSAGVQAGSIQGDMHVEMKPAEDGHRLLFGTIGDNYWGSGSYDREMTVDIKGKDRLGKFILARVTYDDWLVVKVNDHIVYSSAGGQTMIERKSLGWWPAVYEEGTTRRLGPVERDTSWDKWPNIDLRPYLVEGKNTIWTRTLVAGGGENALTFDVHQYCEAVCKERWENQCAEWEQKQ